MHLTDLKEYLLKDVEHQFILHQHQFILLLRPTRL